MCRPTVGPALTRWMSRAASRRRSAVGVERGCVDRLLRIQPQGERADQATGPADRPRVCPVPPPVRQAHRADSRSAPSRPDRHQALVHVEGVQPLLGRLGHATGDLAGRVSHGVGRSDGRRHAPAEPTRRPSGPRPERCGHPAGVRARPTVEPVGRGSASRRSYRRQSEELAYPMGDPVGDLQLDPVSPALDRTQPPWRRHPAAGVVSASTPF